MSIIINKNTRVVVQGITGKEGSFHTEQMIKYGTNIVAGVTPGKGGDKIFDIPVFNTVAEAVKTTSANASIIFVPASFAADAVYEAVDAGIKVIIIITDGVPVLDMIKVKQRCIDNNVVLIGPNCPGIISVDEAKMGIMPGNIFIKGNIGLISRSGTLTYEVADALSKAGLGQTTCVGIGGDPVIGSSFKDILKYFKSDPQTKLVVLIGEIGGTQEEEAAEFIKENNMKAVAFIAGRTAPKGKRMGHAGAIVSGSSGTAEAKIEAFKKAGVPVADTTYQIPTLAKEVLNGQTVKA
ncbi:MAG: succinate--CoA ligase subunit alpha [Armatimonadota bacterium]